MLIKLSSDMYVDLDRKFYIVKQDNYHVSPTWIIYFSETFKLTLSQAHFDELMACLPSPVEASKEEETQPVWAKSDPELLLALREARDEWRATHAKS